MTTAKLHSSPMATLTCRIVKRRRHGRSRRHGRVWHLRYITTFRPMPVADPPARKERP